MSMLLSSLKSEIISTPLEDEISSVRRESHNHGRKSLPSSSFRRDSHAGLPRDSFVRAGRESLSSLSGRSSDIFRHSAADLKAKFMGIVPAAAAMDADHNNNADPDAAKENDRIASTQTEALLILKELIDKAKNLEHNSKVDSKTLRAVTKNKWDFPWTPMKEFNATMEDILIAFCKWGRVNNNNNGNNTHSSYDRGSAVYSSSRNSLSPSSSSSLTKTHQNINVSRAFRRLETYVTWMEDNREMLERPLTVESIAEAAKAFGLRQTHDFQERLVWWIDMNQLDIHALQRKRISIVESLRYFVWLSHMTMFNKRAQENGMIIIQNLAKVNALAKLYSVFPSDVRQKLSRMTIGCLPIKMKKMYIMNADIKASVIMNMIKPFMSQKVRRWVVFIGKKDNAQFAVSSIVGGSENILKNFAGLRGTQEKDIIFGTIMGCII